MKLNLSLKFRYCFVFVCQQGDLELKARLLAASLRHFLRCDFELVAALPTPDAGCPSAFWPNSTYTSLG